MIMIYCLVRRGDVVNNFFFNDPVRETAKKSPLTYPNTYAVHVGRSQRRRLVSKNAYARGGSYGGCDYFSSARPNVFTRCEVD
jgi:hypothetical protein